MEFKATKEEHALISEIVKAVMGDGFGYASALDATMDLEACHSNGCPLDFKRLLAAHGSGDFTHDIAGIAGNIDRSTGELMNCFLPRFAT